MTFITHMTGKKWRGWVCVGLFVEETITVNVGSTLSAAGHDKRLHRHNLTMHFHSIICEWGFIVLLNIAAIQLIIV